MRLCAYTIAYMSRGMGRDRRGVPDYPQRAANDIVAG